MGETHLMCFEFLLVSNLFLWFALFGGKSFPIAGIEPGVPPTPYFRTAVST